MFTSTSTLPNSAMVASTSPCTDWLLVVSAGTAMTRPPVSAESSCAASSSSPSRLAQITTLTPSRASSRAIALPIPTLPPVTMATLSVS